MMTDSAGIYRHNMTHNCFAQHSVTDHSGGQDAKPETAATAIQVNRHRLCSSVVSMEFSITSAANIYTGIVAEFDFCRSARKVDDGERLARDQKFGREAVALSRANGVASARSDTRNAI
jgi:hypothetical protein